MEKTLFKALFALSVTLVACSETKSLTSPDGGIKLTFDPTQMTWSASKGGALILDDCQIGLDILSDAPEVRKAGQGSIKWEVKRGIEEHIVSPLHRQSQFSWTYNLLKVSFSDGTSVEWRVADDAIAYRFCSSLEGRTTVKDETSIVRFTSDGLLTRCRNNSHKNPFKTSFEGWYLTAPLSEGSDGVDLLPSSVLTEEGIRVTLAESDVHSYPVAFLDEAEAGGRELSLTFPPYPGEEWIAASEGPRTYPWRIFKITTEDSAIPEDNVIYALATPSKVEDTSWIRPGFSAWEWWNDWGLEGVGFKPGVNDRTYREYIDFAADYGLEYVILDEGWGKVGPGQNLLRPIKTLDLEGLAQYAASKDVRLILWAVLDRLYKEADEVFERYEDMGIAAFKPDFLDRGDQQAVEMLETILAKAAEHHLMIDCHGIFPPSGLNRTWPNLINVEGIKGLENAKWTDPDFDFPGHDVTLAYLRAMAGPSDYTPGAMRNSARSQFETNYSKPSSMGTRAHQVALYGIYDSPLTMLCDTPTNYRAEDATTRFIASLPRHYDSKKVLCGEMGRFIVVCREKDGAYYLSGITGWDAREVSLNLDFLPEGDWDYELFRDADDSDSNAQNYTLQRGSIASGGLFKLRMASGGGFSAILKPAKD